MLNWIVWNRTDYLYKNGFGNKTQTTNQLKKLVYNWALIVRKQEFKLKKKLLWGCF